MRPQGSCSQPSKEVRGRTKDACRRNYLYPQRTRGGVLLDVIPSDEQDAYQIMKRDHEIGIWTLDFFFTNVEPPERPN